MSRIVRCGLIQASSAVGANRSLAEIKKAMVAKHLNRAIWRGSRT